MSTFFSSMGHISDGVLGRNGRLMFCLLDKKLLAEQVEHSILYLWDNAKLGKPVNLSWTSAALCHPGWTNIEFVAVGKHGKIACLSSDGSCQEIDLKERFPTEVDYLIRAAKVIAGAIYIVGTAHKMFRLTSSLDVENLSVPESQRALCGYSTGFEAVDGFDENEIYAVGWEGEIWFFNGNSWVQMDSPTNLINTSVLCATDSQVYIVGQMGNILIGRREQWHIVATEVDADLWDIAYFDGHIYCCSMKQLFMLNGELLDPISLAPVFPTTFAKLHSVGHAMLSVGMDDVVLLAADKVLKII